MFSTGCIPDVRGAQRLRKIVRAGVVSTYCSLACLLLAVVTLWIATKFNTAKDVVFLDGMLLCVILFFRTVKASENSVAKTLKVTDCKAFATPRDVAGNELRWSIVLGIGFVVCLFSII